MKKAAEKAVEQAKSESLAVLTASKSAPAEVTDGSSAELASEVLIKVSTLRTALDQKRKETTQPSRDETKEIDDAFKEIINALAGPEQALKAQLDTWEEAEEKRVAEEQRKAEEEAARKQVLEDEAAREENRETKIVEQEEVADVGPLAVGGGSVGGVKTWTAEIENVDAIPHDVLLRLIKENPSLRDAFEVAVRGYAKKHKDKAEIPGVRFFQKRHRSIR
jgi:hypothetical protein